VFLRRILEKIGASKNIKKIKTVLNANENIIVENINFLLFFLSSLTILLIAIGNPNCDNVINKLNVGIIIIYIPIPSVPTILVVNILITIPNIFVIAPPNTKISVDLINIFVSI